MLEAKYVRRCITTETEAGRVCSRDTVYLAGGPLLPVGFAVTLHRRAVELHGVRMFNYLPPEPLALLADPACGDAFQVESIFYSTYQQETQHLGHRAFLSSHLRNAARDQTHGVSEYGCLILTVSPIDEHGCFSLTGSVCIGLEMLPRARRVVMEVTSCAPRTFGGAILHVSQADAIVESNRYPATLSPQPPDEVGRQLGRVMAEPVEDGATIQLGFGGTINALATELKDKWGLGTHTKVTSDTVMELPRYGAVGNSRKNPHRDRTMTYFAMGSHAFYDFVNDNPTILHKTLGYTNDLSALAADRGTTSINAALQVDPAGRRTLEGMRSRQISDNGGQVDTAVGAQIAPEGKPVITLRSTYFTKDSDTGERRLRSRILPVLPEGTMVTLARSNTHSVATECGTVCLQGLTVPQQAKALISIAHSDFRDWLEKEFHHIYRL